jgi:hypothetical protein
MRLKQEGFQKEFSYRRSLRVSLIVAEGLSLLTFGGVRAIALMSPPLWCEAHRAD